MAFDISNNNKSRLAIDGIIEQSEDNSELGNLIEQTLDSNVIATQSWVSRLLRRFCRWRDVFHTDVLHVKVEAHVPSLNANTVDANGIYAKSLTLVGKNGQLVEFSVGDDGRLVVSDTFCDVYVYPEKTLVREFLYRDKENVVKNFAGLTEYQVLLNFVPFIGCKRIKYNNIPCQFLCKSNGEDVLVDHTLLFTMPPNKVAKRVVIVDSNGNEVK